MLAVSGSRAAASSINQLQPGSQSSPRPLVDLAPTQSTDDAATDPDRNCVAVADEARNKQARFGTLNWTHGRMSWDWEPGDDPVVVYLMCVNREGSAPMWGGLEFGIGVSWAGAPAILRRTGPLGQPDSLVRPIETPFEIGETPFISWPGERDIPSAPPTDPDDRLGPDGTDAPDDPIGTVSSTPVLFDIPFTTSTAETADVNRPALLDNPIDPAGSLPVPEPSTWILIATGLGLAWRASKKH
jgi:hypothetical protein